MSELPGRRAARSMRGKDPRDNQRQADVGMVDPIDSDDEGRLYLKIALPLELRDGELALKVGVGLTIQGGALVLKVAGGTLEFVEGGLRLKPLSRTTDSTAAAVADLKNDFNNLLAKLRAAGWMER